MTGKELFEQMLALGGKTQWIYPYEPIAKYPAANRAISEINGIFPVTETIQLLHYPILPCDYHKGITVHRGGEDICINARGIKSLAFAVSGTGSAVLSAEGCAKEHEFKWRDLVDFKIFGGIIEELLLSDCEEITLRFTGDYSYMIRDLSLYDELTSSISEDVTVYSPAVAYDMKDERFAGERFREFDALPISFEDSYPTIPQDFRIEGSVIYLPADKPGTYCVRYKRRPTVLTADNEALPIDIDPELEDLVAVRAAYYLYIVSDTEIADRCNAEYQRLLGIAMSTIKKVRTPRRFVDRTGW